MGDIMGENRLFIDGQLVAAESGRTFPNVDPATEQEIGQVADASEADAERAIASARRAFDSTKWSTDHKLRQRCLRQLRDGLREAAPQLREQIIAETGAPLGIVENGFQCDIPIGFLDFYADLLDSYEWDTELPVTNSMGAPSERMVWREPIGVVAAISPWNFPLQSNLAKVGPALAAGCSVILKPSSETPWTATMLGRIAYEHTDIPPGIFNVVTTSNSSLIGDKLVSDPRVDMISFTGSTHTGRHIMAKAASTVKKVFLELGGKSAHIVLDDADLSRALRAGFNVCYHAGQVCALTTRFLLPKPRYEEGIEILRGYFAAIKYGDPHDRTQIMGPLVNRRQQERALRYIEKGEAEGARLVCGGGVPKHLSRGFYVEPTIFADVTNDMTIAQEEIFGPVLAAIAYDGDDDAVRIANDSIYGLSGAIVSADLERALRMARRIRTGTLNINGANYYSADAPFGGYKQSGLGREMGIEGFEEYLEKKTVAIPGYRRQGG